MTPPDPRRSTGGGHRAVVPPGRARIKQPGGSPPLRRRRCVCARHGGRAVGGGLGLWARWRRRLRAFFPLLDAAPNPKPQTANWDERSPSCFLSTLFSGPAFYARSAPSWPLAHVAPDLTRTSATLCGGCGTTGRRWSGSRRIAIAREAKLPPEPKGPAAGGCGPFSPRPTSHDAFLLPHLRTLRFECVRPESIDPADHPPGSIRRGGDRSMARRTPPSIHSAPDATRHRDGHSTSDCLPD